MQSVNISLRKAVEDDRAGVEVVEAQATPNLKYLPMVFDEFVSDDDGEFVVAETGCGILGCGKLTVVPDGSAWLEALRVIPRNQGHGIGKAFYARFFEIARRKGITTMRMYTGVNNKVSKGLAERNGFHLAATYRGASKPVDTTAYGRPHAFQIVTCPERARQLLMPLKARWEGFVVMNRTFYELTPHLCEAWAREGKVYQDLASGSVVALGARFMPLQAVHVAAFSGNQESCLAFAESMAADRGAARIQCMFPPTASDIQETLLALGFQLDASDYIVMEVQVS